MARVKVTIESDDAVNVSVSKKANTDDPLGKLLKEIEEEDTDADS